MTLPLRTQPADQFTPFQWETEPAADPAPRWQIFAAYPPDTTTGPESVSIDILDHVPIGDVVALLKALGRDRHHPTAGTAGSTNLEGGTQ